MIPGVKTVSALDVRKRFGQLLDEAAAGERLLIERAGQPIASLDPDRHRRERLKAIDEVVRAAKRRTSSERVDPAEVVREQRRQRDAQIARSARVDRAQSPET
jgi:antitoxin (DNA-binding transcriptional repressor) of toxin-antitoxin stability system